MLHKIIVAGFIITVVVIVTSFISLKLHELMDHQYGIYCLDSIDVHLDNRYQFS